jgi:hypothetical protein
MDPITAVIVAAVTAGVTEIGKKSFADAYVALKNKISETFGPEHKIDPAISQLEDEPDFPAYQSGLEKRIADAKAGQNEELLELARQLKKALKATPEGLEATKKYQVTVSGNAKVGIIGDNATNKGGMHFN